MIHKNPKLIPGFRGTVEAWECDQMAHMNVQFYATKTTASLAHLQNALGLDPARIRRERKALRYQNLRIQYKSEMRVGALIYAISGIRSVTDDSIQAFTHLFDAQTNQLSSINEFTLRYEDMDNDEKLPLPEDVKAKAWALEDTHEEHYKPAPMKSLLMPETAMEHMFETSRTAVDVWECDAFDTIETRHIIARFSDAASHIMSAVGLTRAMQQSRNLGSAALDYYVEFHKPVKMADAIVLKSGLLDRMPKTFVFGHHMINCHTGEIANSTTVLGCYFDMSSRKSVPLPEEYMSVPEEHLLRNQI